VIHLRYLNRVAMPSVPVPCAVGMPALCLIFCDALHPSSARMVPEREVSIHTGWPRLARRYYDSDIGVGHRSYGLAGGDLKGKSVQYRLACT